MELAIRKVADVHIIEIAGDLDMYSTVYLMNAFNGLLEEKVRKIVVSLKELGYLDSSGVGALLYLHNTTTKQNIHFSICNLKGQPLKVLEMTKLTAFFPIASTVAEAIEQFPK